MVKIIRKRIPEKPLTISEIGSCICTRNNADDPYQYGCHKDGDGSWSWNVNPKCKYHAAAKRQPWNHTIPWNCPTFLDGCNCKGGPYVLDSPK